MQTRKEGYPTLTRLTGLEEVKRLHLLKSGSRIGSRVHCYVGSSSLHASRKPATHGTEKSLQHIFLYIVRISWRHRFVPGSGTLRYGPHVQGTGVGPDAPPSDTREYARVRMEYEVVAMRA